ncbi:MAG TPA: hypothetical protein VF746_03630 [Longimicrobium sp.]
MSRPGRTGGRGARGAALPATGGTGSIRQAAAWKPAGARAAGIDRL